jgi:hypothetical protein
MRTFGEEFSTEERLDDSENRRRAIHPERPPNGLIKSIAVQKTWYWLP